MNMQLNEDWQLTWEPLFRQAADYIEVVNKQKDWLQTNLPCDVHMPLIAQDIIKEPLLADDCFSSEWIEKRSWWFKKQFDLTEEQFASERLNLAFESLDVEADIWLNDSHLGHHRSAFYPFAADIKAKAKVGANQIMVRVTSGLELYSEQDLALIGETKVVFENDQVGQRGDNRRGMLRKAQYVYGWDWGPRVATCGIMGGVTIECFNSLQIRNVYATTVGINAKSTAQVRFQIEMENLHPFKTLDASLKLELFHDAKQIAILKSEPCLRSGLNYITLELEVIDAKLWWPNGMGEASLYSVKVEAQSKSHFVEYPTFDFGIRTLHLNVDKLPQGIDERAFAFEINGVALFSKGGNWIPADSIYARVTDAKYEALIKEAKEANFNMLRIWGGGIYERDAFYTNCDKYGILVWHDFMFSCAKYPDQLAWFREEVEKEIDYQTRRLRNHCSIALWCGNNENHWGFDEWWNETEAAHFYGGAVCYNEIAPRLVQQNCPEIPYWNSSPYGGEKPNGSQSGDRHHWHDCMMSEDMEKRITPEEYDKVTAKFVSEYGYVGPCRKSTIEIYHNGQILDRESKVWQLHNNTFEKDTVLAGINKHYVDSQQMEIDNYLLYAGLCQGLMYGYSLEAMRSKLFCAGALFWMYNDCWGEVGWTIIDYYLTRKISYYFVKRAFEPVKLILRQKEGLIQLTVVNETREMIKDSFEYGLMRYDGKEREAKQIELELPPHSRSVLLEWTAELYDPTQAFIYVKPIINNNEIKPVILRAEVFRELKLPEAKLKVEKVHELDESHTSFIVSSDTFAHAVHFSLDETIHLNDEYFDLLPGEQREIVISHPGHIILADGIVPSYIKVMNNAHS
ncbi:beta-mannosidase [Paenibacillus psychroresistens]|uniref:beta-mannosidase n=1 Tax=Paenibacillus psychroresistens TaxID=1778678 RepID=A0A6B8RG14_9BACL|nr:sugar-binding domain-containing protein [Paenibacillus psychroresistens]QGQ95120.1 beta-mannosidase [Paenibacillus psychroresistens]